MKFLITLSLMFASCLIAVGQKMSDAQSLVDAERAFARASVEKGTRPAFMEFIADDGILFRPGAVKGKQWMIDHPAPPPPKNKRPVLNWGPTFAVVSRAGDLGYDFGPWEARADIKDEKPAAFGHFITVWKRQADGSWKFAVDLGISHPGPHPGPPEWKPEGAPLPDVTKSKMTAERARELLLMRDRAYSDESVKWGARQMFAQRAANDVRVFREGKLPFVGLESALTVLPVEKGDIWTWQPIAGDVSASRDLAYTYGTYTLKHPDTQKVEHGNYLRIWTKRSNDWIVVVDVANPVE